MESVSYSQIDQKCHANQQYVVALNQYQITCYCYWPGGPKLRILLPLSAVDVLWNLCLVLSSSHSYCSPSADCFICRINAHNILPGDRSEQKHIFLASVRHPPHLSCKLNIHISSFVMNVKSRFELQQMMVAICQSSISEYSLPFWAFLPARYNPIALLKIHFSIQRTLVSFLENLISFCYSQALSKRCQEGGWYVL